MSMLLTLAANKTTARPILREAVIAGTPGHLVSSAASRLVRTILTTLHLTDFFCSMISTLRSIGRTSAEYLTALGCDTSMITTSLADSSRMKLKSLALLFAVVGLAATQTPTLGLSDGFISLDTPTFSVQLVKDSQTLYSLSAKSSSFNFVPTDQMTLRQYNGNYHLGDITFRVRTVGSTSWISGDTSTARKTITALPASGSTLAAASLAPTLSSTSPLNITRRWVVANNSFQLLFDVSNPGKSSLEIGSLGAPLEFNNVSSETALETIQTIEKTFPDLYEQRCYRHQ